MKSLATQAVHTVGQITAAIKFLLESEYRFVAISGEISNLRTPFSGHQYFTLKDATAQLRAVLLKPQLRYLSEPLRDGRQVICRGRISVYEPRGEYQLVVDTVEQQGAGALMQQFIRLQEKLAAEGLFDPARKRPIPAFPAKVVVLTSPTGAAIHDFLKIWSQRASTVQILVYPVAVQGRTAAAEMARALDRINRDIPCDAIVLCRGGGSLEDLFAFNEEILARAIARSQIPTISGVGHEIDSTIADFCADRRAPTPTGAAELLIPDANRLRQHLGRQQAILVRTISERLRREEYALEQQNRMLGGFSRRLTNLELRLHLGEDRFHHAFSSAFNRRENLMKALLSRLETRSPVNQLQIQGQHLSHLHDRLIRQMAAILHRQADTVASLAALLHSYSPLATLARGYAIVRVRTEGDDGYHTLISSSEVQAGDEIETLLHQGKLISTIVRTE